MKKKINPKSKDPTIWMVSALGIAILIFLIKYDSIESMGLGSSSAFSYSFPYIYLTAAIAAILSFLINKFKFNALSFFKFWFWILILTFITIIPDIVKILSY